MCIRDRGYPALLERLKTRESVDELGLTVSGDARDAYDLARADLKGYVYDRIIVMNLRCDRHALNIEDVYKRQTL